MIDKAIIHLEAGKGGAGAVHFVKRKGKVFGPPDGGDGGKGGDVYAVATHSHATLAEFRYRKLYKAEDGQPGGTNQKSGEAGDDMHIAVPKGTIIRLGAEGPVLIDMANTTEPVLLAKGGLGGKGNMHMRKYASRAHRPVEWEMWQKAQPGQPGEQFELALELKLIADIGLVGLPNAGKSTLLSVLTKARPKIAEYPFTTLEPNLGVMYEQNSSYIIADIPGLIEGASEGKGLGKEFLRHIERTQVIVHLTTSVDEYYSIRKELENHSKELAEKPEIVALSKIDTISQEEIVKKIEDFSRHQITVLPISAATHKGLDELKNEVVKHLE